MYKKHEGSRRLVNALDRADIRRLAAVLNYHEPQLQEDIRALKDYYDEAEERRAEE